MKEALSIIYPHSNFIDIIFSQVLSEVGTVHTVLDSGDLRVRYPSNLVWTMNPDTVSVVGVRIASE